MNNYRNWIMVISLILALASIIFVTLAIGGFFTDESLQPVRTVNSPCLDEKEINHE